MDNIYEKVIETAQYIKSKIEKIPEIAIILGSGLGILVEEIENKITINYKDIPNFPISTVQGHAGQLVFGKIGGKYILAMNGRFHYYEGYEMSTITFPIRLFKMLGIKDLIVTNACGGINKEFEPGDLMLISDHIKFFNDSPLRGKNQEEFGPRFFDLTQAYDKNYRDRVKEIAKNLEIDIKEGVYAFMPGPMYETPAEIKMLSILGADAVGMSTVPEVLTARHSDIKVLGISCITNMAAGILDKPLCHDEVIETANNSKHKFLKLIKGIIENLF